MINLLPLRARKDVKVEYWIRVISVWLFLVSFAFFIIGILLLPSLILIQSQLKIYNSSYQQANAENNLNKQLEESIKTANGIAQRLVQVTDTRLFTTLLAQIEEATGKDIVIDSVLITRTEGKIDTIKVTGNAASRNALVLFRDTLEASDDFESAALPLSNLAKDKDIPFNIDITVVNTDTP